MLQHKSRFTVLPWRTVGPVRTIRPRAQVLDGTAEHRGQGDGMPETVERAQCEARAGSTVSNKPRGRTDNCRLAGRSR